LKTALEKKLVEQNQDWKKAIEGILDAYLGRAPKEFDWNGKKYTPATFRDAMGLKASDYVSITSFNHHPFNSQFILEVPDNFSHGSFYNVTIDELVAITENAINNGYSVAWDADVSEKTFSFKNGMAIMPAADVKPEEYFKKVVPENKVTQEERQNAFETLRTTDDHLMHLVGLSKDQNGTMYFVIKNSWGKNNPYGGLQYISTEYFRGKTVAILLHKDGVPKDIRKNLGF
jgi:bleomycin hydrolase